MTQSNKDMAVLFLELTASGEVREAYSKLVSPAFKHHNPYFEGSAESLMLGMEENARQNPGKSLEVKRIIAEDDYVVVHTRVRHHAGEPGFSVVHIFRFENGQIEELWDVGQPVLEESPNEFGMF